MWKLRKSSSGAIIFMILLSLQLCWQGNARHYFMKSSEKPIKESKTTSDHLNFETEYHECYILVQETRKIGGQCVKIRENFQGCVAGSLMDPFHQDCL